MPAAAEAFRRALRADSTYHRARHNLAVVLADLGQAPAAVNLLETTVAAAPHFEDALRTLALLHAKAGRYPRAIELLRAGAALPDPPVDFFWRLGQLLDRQGRHPEAEPLLRRATAEAPQDPEVWRQWGLHRQRQGAHADALKAFERALATDPHHIEAHYNRAQALYALKERVAADGAMRRFDALSTHAAHIAHLRRALDAEPNHIPTRLRLAHHYDAVGDPASAETHFRAALLEDARHTDALVGLSRLLLRQGRGEEALALCISAASRQDPPQPLYPIVFAAGDVHFGLGRLEAAEAAYRRCLDLQPGFAPASNRLGEIAQQRGRPAAALQHFNRAVASDPAYAAAHLNLGLHKQRWGDPAGARLDFERAVRHDSTLAEAYAALGGLYEAIDSTAAATRAYRSFLNHWQGESPRAEAIALRLRRLQPESP